MEEENEPGQDIIDNPDSGEVATASETQPQSGWEGLSDDDKAFVEEQGWGSPLDVLKSYRELQTSAGSKIEIPKADDAKAWKKLDALLGRPETIEGYEIDPRETDKPYIDDFKKASLEAGLRPSQVSKIYDWYTNQNDKMTEVFNQQVEKDKEEVKALWGNDYSKNEEQMNRGFRMLELSPEQLENIEFSIGTKAFMQLGKKLGDFISEDSVKGLGGAATRTEELSTEDFIKEIFKKETNEGK